MGEARLGTLRAKATQAIGIQPAGASSSLRLTLSPDMCADPGFYQLWHLVNDLRRLGKKQPDLVGQWASFVSHFSGRYFPGPFSSLLQLCTKMGWWIEPPFLVNARGIRVDLFRAPKGLLRKLLEQGWANLVAGQHRHRKSMTALQGLDLVLAHLDDNRLQAVELARVRALQSGSNIANAQHCRYDLTKDEICAVCGVSDTVQHKVRFCAKYTDCRHGSSDVLDRWDDLPDCLTHHLLAPENPFATELQLHFTAIPTQIPGQDFDDGFEHWRDLFTDGTRLFEGDLAVAAWSVVDATANQVVAAHELAGLPQTVPRAELAAALFAVQWGAVNRIRTRLWTDSTYVADGINELLQGVDLGLDVDNGDLWDAMRVALQRFPDGALKATHIPSHLDPGLCEDDFELWIAKFNDYADAQAGLTNQGRSQQFVEMHNAASQIHTDWAYCIRKLRTVYLKIAERTAQGIGHRTDAVDTVEEDEQIWRLRAIDLQDCLPLNWRGRLVSCPGGLPVACLTQIMKALLSLDVAGGIGTDVSWIELVFGWYKQGFQFWVRPHGDWVVVEDNLHRPRPNISVLIHFVRSVCTVLFKHLGLDDLLVTGVDVTRFGVTFPQGGLRFGPSPGFLNQAHDGMKAAFSKLVRCVADLARPMG